MYHRKPAVAGAFYPSGREELESMIDGYVSSAEESAFKKSMVGVIAPHAGYVYSGPVAGWSFRQLMGSGCEVAIVLAPSHRARFDGASVIPEGIYETPLGDVEIDAALAGGLSQMPGFGFIKQVHESEHSLEVQVPFLQRVLSSFTIVPIIVGTTDIDMCRNIAEALKDVISGEKRKCSIVISTDLSHYHSHDEATLMDRKFIDALETFSEDEVKKVLISRKAEACGEGPVIAGMLTSRMLGASRFELLHYATSGDTAGDRAQVVGYLSGAFVR